MLFLKKKQAAAASTSQKETKKEDDLTFSQAQIRSIEKAVFFISTGDTRSILVGREPIDKLLAPLAYTLAEHSKSRLSLLTDVWSKQTEPLMGIAQMMADMRDMQHRNQSIAAATEEMAASISEVARSSNLVSEESDNVKNELVQSVSAVDRAVATMDQISVSFTDLKTRVQTLDEASQQISAITKTIEQIAGQTNLLALNATIEAARAGEAGKGFAVVAGEVKNLANQTATATEDIRNRIAALQDGMNDMLSSMTSGEENVETGTKVIHQVGESIRTIEKKVEDVVSNITSVSSNVSEQTQVTSELASTSAAIVPMTDRMISSVENLTTTINEEGTIVQAALNDIAQNPDDEMLVLVTIADHCSFKKKIIDTLLGREKITSADLPDQHKCRLGQWCDEKVPANVRHLEAFSTLEAPHRRVHETGKAALDHYHKGDRQAALESAREMSETSLTVIEILHRLYNEMRQMRLKEEGAAHKDS